MRFKFAKSRVENIVLPHGMTAIGERAFFQCESLKSITIPASVSHIESDAFCECIRLESVYTTEGSYAAQWCRENGLEDKLMFQ